MAEAENRMQGAEKETLTTANAMYPQIYWGLDPTSQTFCKLYIRDVLTMTEYSSATPVQGVFSYMNHPVSKVDLMGVIVRVEQRSKQFLYAIDDSTGVINCCCWNPDPLTVKQCIIPGLKEKVEETEKIQQCKEEGFNLGDLLHVRGKIKIFREQREIMASYFAIEKDPNAELNRMLEVQALHQLFYDKPFQLSNIIKNCNSHNLSLIHLTASLQDGLMKLFEESRTVQFCMADLETSEDVKSLIDQNAPEQSVALNKRTLLDQVVNQLEESGFLLKHQKKREHYRVIMNDVQLIKIVLNLLQKECAREKYAEKGCHYLHILGEIRKAEEYCSLNSNAILKCLQKLEEESRIISTTDKHFASVE
ncbi:CST complex subunit STN1 [Lingula anatina]|uniref:CST complex subunit STN1 n=1 Tax=Lingula anatina TaxID=7574 RepID=A0A1S3JUA1_LINAN|nr:CST complex subunit STN1 [Lingula anatina]XP_013413948.1 CST complex subunit STN1 [Lingula anatina]XP_013413949.1 CST complex subunit STN1 [Lingula anatina]XP_013413950.1 CST complex subunit STN1 [Lingula anatina]XP_013413951.1 CST complex subunit STN1 [Lingula anatina]|eukprot:XP_013413947.1 CST complex subunit STN1 [Lingula anatina]